MIHGRKYALVAGGAGFIGSHLVESLIDDGWVVDVIDNFVTGNIESLRHSMEKAQELPDRTLSLKIASIDVVRISNDPSRADETPCFYDIVYNLACPASPKAYQANPLETVLTSVVGTANLLALAEHHQAVFVQASTSEIYGDPLEHPQKETYWGHVNSYGPRACYSDDTDVLTSEGWIPINQVALTHQIATADEERRVTYVTPKEIIVQSFDGDMLRFVNQKIDLMVTPNHMMVDDSKESRRFVQADADVGWSHLRVPVGGVWSDSTVEEEHLLPEASRNAKVTFEKIPTKDWLEFVGIYLAEGCTTFTPKKKIVNGVEYKTVDYRVTIAYDDNWKKQKIKACLDKLPWKYHELDHQFQIMNKQLTEALAPFGRVALEKSVPREYIKLPPQHLRVLFDGIMLDGAHDGSCFTSVSERLANEVQEIALRLGKAASLVRYTHTNNPWSDRPMYRVNLRSSEHAMYPIPETVPYKGNVYCVDLPPNRTLFVRRNGKVCLGSNCYDEGKRTGETLCYDFRKRGVDVRVARIFNTYGPRMAPDDGRVVSTFVRQAIDGEPLTVFGEGTQTRSFCYVSDLVRGLRMLAEAPSWTHGPVNLGNDGEFKVIELVEMLSEWFPRVLAVNEPLPKDDPNVRRPDLTLAKSKLGYEPKVPLREGLEKTIMWMKEHKIQKAG